MEKSNQTNSFTCFIRKAWKIFLPVLFLLFTFFLILAVILPAKNAELTLPADAKIQMVNTSLLNDSLYRDIQDIESENAWLRARLNAVNSDSLSLLINLPDSTLSLQMDGVIVFETQITKYKKSRLFNKYSRQFLAEWSEDPLTVTNTVSSIPKMPVVYKKAPKDTLEAARQDNLTETPDDHEDTWFCLFTDKNLKLAIRQLESPSTLIPDQRHRYYRKIRKLERRELVKSMANFKIPVHYAYINIYVSRSDATVIYRALPEHSLVVLRL